MVVIEYRVGSRYYRPSEEPPIDAVGLFIEATPVFKIWFAPPLDFERECLAGRCSAIGFLPPQHVPGGVPFARFEHPARGSMFVRAPISVDQEVFEKWAASDTNGFMLVLIERGSQIVRQIRHIGIPDDYRRKLVKAWSDFTHPFDLDEAVNAMGKMSDQQIVDASDVWVYNADTDDFEFQVTYH